MRALAIVVLLLAGCASAPLPTDVPATNRPSNAPSVGPTRPTASQPASPTPSPAPTGTMIRNTPRVAFGDGLHLVPSQVQPGTYRTVSKTEDCYWTRLRGFDSGLEDWISSSIGPGYHVVTIGIDDLGFDSQRCSAWTDELGVANGHEIGEGTYVVGLDMVAGEWTAASGANCYWARLSGFGGTQDEVVAEELTNEALAPVVTITATDVGFTSNGCGEWRATQP